MAKDRPHINARGSAQSRLSKDDAANHLTELRRDPPFSPQRPSSSIQHIDELYPQLQQRWTAPQLALAESQSNRAMRKMSGGRCIQIKAVPPPKNNTNWNDIPEDMLNSSLRGTKPRTKVEAMQRRKSRHQKAAIRQKNMAERHQRSSEDKDLDTGQFGQQAQNTLQLNSPKMLLLDRVATIKPDPHLQKFKFRRSLSSCNIPQTRFPAPYSEVLAVSISDDAGDINEHSEGSEDIEVSSLEDIDFEQIAKSSGAASEHVPHLEDEAKSFSGLDTMSDGLNDGNGGTGSKQDSTKVDITACSIHNCPNMNDKDVEHTYLKGREAVSEPEIFPKDTLERLRTKVEDDKEQRRKKDSRYQHDLMMAKVKVAQVEHGVRLPKEVLYPKPAYREKSYLDTDDWDLLDDFQVKQQPDQENETESDITSRYDDELERDAISFPQPEQVVQSVPKRTTGRLEKVYGLASKAGKFFPSKPTAKPVEGLDSVNRRKAGWTMADLLEDN